MKDLFKIIAFVKIYGLSIYGTKHFNVDHGKDNLESYFLPLGWTKTKIKEAVKILRDNDIITKVKADAPNFYSLSSDSFIKTMLSSIDLFENYKLLPQEVQNILAKYDNDDNTYENCENLVADLETVGYTCDYELDGVPFDLRKIS